MARVVFIAISEASELITELEKIGNYELRVAQSAVEAAKLGADIYVFDADTVPPGGAKNVRIFDRDGLDASAASIADDFILRPISGAELSARITRLIAPENRNSEKKVFKRGELQIDFSSAKVYLGEEMIHLTLLEYKLLALLAQSYGRVVTYKEILESLWEYPLGNEMLSIRVFVAAIRSKLAAAGATEQYIVNRMSKGYELI